MNICLLLSKLIGSRKGPPPTYTISGDIVDGAAAAIEGVTVTLTGDASDSTTTDASGDYAFTGLVDGSYTVTPTKTGNTFAPTSDNVTISGASDTSDFVGIAIWSISGDIVDGAAAAIEGVLVTLSGDADDTDTTDSNGHYEFTGLVDGSYTVTPTKTGYGFTPTSDNVTISGASDTSDFVGLFAAAFYDFDADAVGGPAGATSAWYRGSLQSDAEEVYTSTAALFDNRIFKAIATADDPLELLIPIIGVLPRTGKIRVAVQWAGSSPTDSAFRVGLTTGLAATHTAGDYVRMLGSCGTSPDTLYIEDKTGPGVIASGTCGIDIAGNIWTWYRMEIDYDAETISVHEYNIVGPATSTSISVAFPIGFAARVFDTLFVHNDNNNAYAGITVSGCWIGTGTDAWPAT